MDNGFEGFSERTETHGQHRLTLTDLQRATDAVVDLDDPIVMDQAWH